MDIGVPRERRPDEYRVGLTPTLARLLVGQGHRCYVEESAGLGAGFSDEAYAHAGATIVYSGEEVYGRADLVVKVGRPMSVEMSWLRPRQTILAFWHLASASPDKAAALSATECTAIAYEMIEADDGSRPVLRSMSQIAGRMAPNIAASLLRNDRGGKGILLGGVPGVPPAEVVILGAGVVGTNAARAFAGLGATVHLLDCDLERLEQVAERDGRVITMLSNARNIEKVVHFADVLVGAVLVPGERAPVLVSRQLMVEMRRRSIIIDIAIDQGGCFETSRPTTHESPIYIAEGMIHYCVPNMAGVLGRTATHALTNTTWPFIEILAGIGVEGALAQSESLARGVAVRDGRRLVDAVWGEVGR